MNRNVPKLRFKGFEDKWEEKKLGDLVNYKKGYAFKSNNYVDNGIRIIKISDTTANSVSEFGNAFIANDNVEKFSEWRLKTGDIIISTVGSRPPLYSSMVGKVVKIPEVCDGGLLNQNLVKLVPKASSNNFLYSIFKKPNYVNYIENICRGNANQVSITLEDLFEYRIKLPSLQEQEKIANFLTKVDGYIEKQDEKVKELNLYKKGMMQKIFSQEVRFKDENDCEYAEWEEKKLGTQGNIITGNTPSTARLEYYGGGYLWASPIDLGKGKYVRNTKTTLAYKGFLKTRMVNKGSVLVTCIGSTIGKIGMASVDMATNQQINSFYSEVNSNEFIYYYLQYSFNKYLAYISFQAVPIINKSQFENFDIQIPNIDEQTKIANFLSNIDNIIEKENKKLEELKLWKKGLLQQMFV